MMFSKITATGLCAALAFGSLSAHALQITDFNSLTEKKIKQSYYFDWNRNGTFRTALFKAFKASNVPVPEWMRQGSGPASPGKLINRGATHYVLLDTCKARECGDNIAFVLFDPATKSLASVAKIDKKTVWVGKPIASVKQILSNASGLR